MNNEVKYALYLIGLGMSMGFAVIVYAHASFASKTTVEKMDERIYEIWKEVVKRK
jgi:hypothetical protein